MSIKLNTEHIIRFLKDENLHSYVRNLSKEKYIQNERTLQAYIWNHMRSCFLKKRPNNKNLYFQDYFIDVEGFDGKTKTYPDLSVKHKFTHDMFFVIELKHYSENYNVTSEMLVEMKKDITKLNNNPCPGALVFTCPSENHYETALIELNNLKAVDTSIITILCEG